jgi:NAD(P)-dependent dehydrogenase (short-subunit alcohol dehydrogenase family)
MGRLDGKVAVLTGAGSGIARAAAQMFTREGAKVVVAEINESLGADSADRAGPNAIFVPTDVTDDASVKNTMAVAADTFGRIDILHNCAGGSVIEDKNITDVDLAVWDRTIPLDLKGPMLCCRHGVPHLQAAGGGSIINMSSVVALRGNHPSHIYAAAKGGIIAFTQSLAGAYSKDGIRANAVCPGLVLTDRVRARAEGAFDNVRGDSDAYDTFKQYPFGVGQPEDIANIVLFLASDESRMVNGATIPAEGGISAY